VTQGRALKAAFSMFTIVPLEVEGEDVVALSHKLWMITIVGAFYGLLAGAVFTAVGYVTSYLVGGVVAFLLVQWMNRFLHFDGLSDLGDGLVCTGTLDKKLAAMKDSHTGAGGMGYALMFTAMTLAAYASVPLYAVFFMPFAAEVLSRLAMVACASGGRSTKEGLGGIFVRNVTSGAVLVAFIIAFVFTAAAALLPYPVPMWTAFDSATLAWFYTMPVALLLFGMLAVLIGRATARVAMRNFGVVNGDILGATNEMARALLLVVMLVVFWCLGTLP
jgi:adenosylcobinamide-GDP ribazoletransferase